MKSLFLIFFVLVNQAVRGNDLILQRQIHIGVGCLGFLTGEEGSWDVFKLQIKPGWSDNQLKFVD